MQPVTRSRAEQQQQTRAAFAQTCSGPRSGQMPGFLLAVRREGALVFLPCAHFSTDINYLTTF